MNPTGISTTFEVCQLTLLTDYLWQNQETDYIKQFPSSNLYNQNEFIKLKHLKEIASINFNSLSQKQQSHDFFEKLTPTTIPTPTQPQFSLTQEKGTHKSTWNPFGENDSSQNIQSLFSPLEAQLSNSGSTEGQQFCRTTTQKLTFPFSKKDDESQKKLKKRKLNVNAKQFFSTKKSPCELIVEEQDKISEQFLINSFNDQQFLFDQQQEVMHKQFLQNQQQFQNSPCLEFQPQQLQHPQTQNYSIQFPSPIMEPQYQSQPLQIDRKPLILENSQQRQTGVLKYFDANKNYGFIVIDIENKEIFFHYQDISNAQLTKERLQEFKEGKIIRLSFIVCTYIGKYNKSKKATDIKLIE